MNILRALLAGAFFGLVKSTLLIDFNADRGDEPSVLGQLNLQEDRDTTIDAPTSDLYFKKGADWQGNHAAHVHRKVGYIRSEYHSLKDKTQAGETYYIGYKFALQELQKSLMIWQWKEYEANNEVDGGANIPLALEWIGEKLVFQYQNNITDSREAMWAAPINDHTVYTIGIEIYAHATKGTARLWFNGKPVTMTGGGGKGTTTVPGNTFPGNCSPKFGAYRGEEVEINTWIYNIQIGTKKTDLDASFFS